jgi:CheY-like chemotaxis protein
MMNTRPASAGQIEQPKPAVACLVEDIFFVPRLTDVIERLGGVPVLAETAEALVDAVDRTFPVLVLVDLNAAGDWQTAIRRLKHRPHSKRTPVYAFGAHVEPAVLQAARQAGADHAWARSKMMSDLPTVVERHLHPPVRYLEGWDDELSALAKRGVAEFNRGDYYEQHEYFEAAWMEEARPIRDLYQGILQVGVSFYLIEQDNWTGAVKMIRRGLSLLRDLPAVSQGIDLAAFRAQAEYVHAALTALGPERLGDLESGLFPQIELVEEGDGQSTIDD